MLSLIPHIEQKGLELQDKAKTNLFLESNFWSFQFV
jgi:hypothetical protein